MSVETLEMRKERSSLLSEAAILWTALAIGVLKLWLLPLSSSFWVDETGTFWTVKDGIGEAISRCYLWPSQSPLYSGIAWAALQLGGPPEIALRLPSTLAALASIVIVYRLGLRLLNPSAAMLASIVFACGEPVAFAAADARPYAIALFASLLAISALVRWFDTERLSYAAGYVAAAALTIHLHYIFGLALLVHAVYALYRMRFAPTLTWGRLIGAGVGVGVLTAPLLPHFLLVAKNTKSWASSPTPRALAGAVASPDLFAGIFAGVLLAVLFTRKPQLRIPPITREALVLLISWFFLPILILFLISVVSPSKIFLPRYYLFALPASALLMGWVLSSIQPTKARVLVAISIVLAAISTFGGLWRTIGHGREDWRAALATVRSIVEKPSTPVFVRSGFVESAYVDWLSDSEQYGYLYAPLLAYPPAGRIIRLPYSFDEKARRYFEKVLATLDDEDSVIFLTSEPQGWFDHWVAGRLAGAGFDAPRLWTYKGYVRVLLFERSAVDND